MANIAGAFAALSALEVFTQRPAKDRPAENADETETAATPARREAAAERPEDTAPGGAQDAGKPRSGAGRRAQRPGRFATAG